MSIIRTAPADPGRLRLALVLGTLSAFAAMTIDLYLPAMPVMAADLHTGAGLVQLTLTVFVVGLALCQVVAGSLSDAWGRRPPLLAGLGLYVVGSLTCAVAPHVGWLLAGRVLQSIGAAAATVLSRAIVRDLFHGTEMTRFFSTLMLVNGVAPVVAPVVGAQLLGVASWRAVFVVLAIAGALALVVVVRSLPESLPRERRRPADLGTTLRAYAVLARDASFVRYVLAAALMFASMFAYISGSSFVLQDVYGLSAQEFSLVFAANGLGIVVLGQVNGALVGRVADERTLLGTSLVVGTLGGLGVLLSTIAALPLGIFLASLFTLVAVLGPVLANATSLALADHASAAGAASSFQGLLQFLAGGLVASLMGGFGDGTALPMAVAVCLSATAALVVFAAGVRVRSSAGRRRTFGERSVGARATS